MTQTYDANDILMGGKSAPAWKFDEPGTTRVGTIAAPPTARQEREYDRDNPGGGDLKFFPSGDPIMGIVVEVATNERDPGNAEDDGKRTFYIEGRYIKEAVRNAVRASGAGKLEVGGQLSVTFTHREDPMDKRSRKFWNVVYTPAAQAQLMTEQGPVNGATGEIQPPAPAPVAQPAPPAQAPAPQQQPAAAASAPQQPAGPTPEQVAAVKAAGLDPTQVFPGYVPQG